MDPLKTLQDIENKIENLPAHIELSARIAFHEEMAKLHTDKAFELKTQLNELQ